MRFNFARKARRVARRQYRRGKITRQEYEHVCEASRDPEVVAKWEAEVEKQLGAPWKAKGGFLDGFDFSAIWEWFKENWPTILKILLTILPLLILEPSPEEEGESES
jgi:hypothetical protein